MPGKTELVINLAGQVAEYCDWVRGNSWICNLYLSVAAYQTVTANLSLRYALHAAAMFSFQEWRNLS